MWVTTHADSYRSSNDAYMSYYLKSRPGARAAINAAAMRAQAEALPPPPPPLRLFETTSQARFCAPIALLILAAGT